VDLLGEVPAHWVVTRLSQMGRLFKGSGGTKEDEAPSGVPCVRYGDLYTTHEYFIERTRSYVAVARASAYTRLCYGDILFAASGETNEDIGRSAVNLIESPAYCGGDVILFRPSVPAFARFMGYVSDSPSARRQKSCLGRGITVEHIYADQLKTIRLAMPPMDEQRAIATFLDRRTAKIDELIAKKVRLIELLREMRTSLITQAVTKGLDPDVPIKDSGVDWFRNIPAHWSVAQLKRAITFQRGHDLPTDSRDEGTVPVVSSGGVTGVHSRHAARGPGIVTGRYGTIGHFHLIEDDYWPLNTTLYSIDLHGNDPAYLVGLLTHLSPLFLLNAVKSAIPGVDRNDIHPIPAALPSLGEQREIAKHITTITRTIEVLSSQVYRAIALLREYRAALISAAVRGQIDVRGEVA
jgi:type I restriction enzyme S subunit